MIKELGGFDFTAVPSLPKALVGNPGTGKTHVLLGLGMEAIRKGFRVRFVTAGALVNELLLARAEFRVHVPFSREAAQLLFAFGKMEPFRLLGRDSNCRPD